MPKREDFYGKDAWMDPKFDLVAATTWLRIIDENDPLLFQMLERATNGEYESINKDITGFIVAVYRSKHSENDSVTSYLFKNLRDDLLESLAFEKIPPDGLI